MGGYLEMARQAMLDNARVQEERIPKVQEALRRRCRAELECGSEDLAALVDYLHKYRLPTLYTFGLIGIRPSRIEVEQALSRLGIGPKSGGN